jgi:aminopeptidase N
MAFLDGRFASKGGLKPFMNKLLEDRVFAPMFTEEFRADMENFYGDDLKDVFNTYIYKGNMPTKSMEVESHPIHKKMSLKDMYSIL